MTSSWSSTNCDEPGSGWDGYVVEYELGQPMPEAERQDAIDIARALLQPATKAFIRGQLLRLRARTASRATDDVDLGMTIEVFVDDLRHFPADIIADVLEEHGLVQKFWPSLSDLFPKMDRRMKPRVALLQALERGYVAPETSPDWLKPTEAEKVEALAFLAKHGYTIDADGRVRPPETMPLSAADRRRVREETARFKLVDADDPRVQRWLEDEGAGGGRG